MKQLWSGVKCIKAPESMIRILFLSSQLRHFVFKPCAQMTLFSLFTDTFEVYVTEAKLLTDWCYAYAVSESKHMVSEMKEETCLGPGSES